MRTAQTQRLTTKRMSSFTDAYDMDVICARVRERAVLRLVHRRKRMSLWPSGLASSPDSSTCSEHRAADAAADAAAAQREQREHRQPKPERNKGSACACEQETL